MKYLYAEVRWLPATNTHGAGYFVRLYNCQTGMWEIVGESYSRPRDAECALNIVVSRLSKEDDCVKEEYNNVED